MRWEKACKDIHVGRGRDGTGGVNYPARSPRPRIRPNPNAGQFTVEFDDLLQRDSYYSVFDAMGRLLYQRPLQTGATQQDIDLSRFGRGTYILHITMPEGVSQERVVIE